MPRRTAIVLLALGACAAPVPTVPESVRLTETTATVAFATGATCRAAWSVETPRAALAGCPPGWTVAVEPDPARNPVRIVVEAVFEALALEGVLSPVARVVVTDPSGRAWTFVSPDAAS